MLLAGACGFGSIKISCGYDVEDKAAKKLKVYGAAQAKDVNGSAAAASDDPKIYTLQASHNLSKRASVHRHLTAASNSAASALGFNSTVARASFNGVQFGLRHRL